MDSLLATLKHRQELLRENGARLVEATRDRGLSTLGTIRNGTLDWQATLDARRRELEVRSPRWLSLRLGLVNQLDELLAALGERVRHEIERLSRLELAAKAPTPNASPKKAKTKLAPKQATAKAKRLPKPARKAARPASRRLVMPIREYDSLTAKEVISELSTLTPAQCRTIIEHEKSHKNRKTVLRALDARLAA